MGFVCSYAASFLAAQKIADAVIAAGKIAALPGSPMIQCLIDTTQNTQFVRCPQRSDQIFFFPVSGEPFDYSFWRKHLQLAAYQPDIFVTGQGMGIFTASGLNWPR